MSPARYRRVFLFFLLFLFLFLFLYWLLNPLPEDALLPISPANTPTFSDTLPSKETTFLASTPIAPPPASASSGSRDTVDTLPYTVSHDSALLSPIVAPPALLDTTPPLVAADLGPGLYPEPIEVALFSNEPAHIDYALSSDTMWQPYALPLQVSDSMTLYFRGTDSAGNLSVPIRRDYLVRAPDSHRSPCPRDMAFIDSHTPPFCIDRYEWPNQKGLLPTSYINWYMAYDSCRAKGKRLCKASEWEAACSGRFNHRYPYGDRYEQQACNTETQGTLPSGQCTECRAYAGVFDLSGNLREWTATQEPKNPRHYQVYGGYYDSRTASGCRTTQYSFFPENKFIFIGFRCCQDKPK